MRSALGALGVVLVVFSAFFVAMAISELAGGGDGKTEPSVLWGLLVFFLGTGIAGLMLARANFRAAPSGPPPAAAADPEQRILDLAHSEGGRVTVEEVASCCDLSLEESKQLLDRLAARRVADMHVTDDGIVVYVFPGFLPDAKKREARRL